MTEQEWLGFTDPGFYVGLACISHRKRRLYAVACCRRIMCFITDPRSRTAIEVAEQYAEGAVPKAELHAARDGAREALRERKQADPNLEHPGTNAVEAAKFCASGDSVEAAEFGAGAARAALGKKEKAEQLIQARLLREIVG